MGSRKTNFYVDLACRFGFEKEALRVQELYLEGEREKAYEAIPDELIAKTSMIGTEAEVAERIEAFAKGGVDRMIVSPVQLDPEQRKHTVERLGAIASAMAPA
jgi:alkanesulfonate monooxygenase SsuD/methylene tetrahydromethanopterin reductase-like flavin-dependent oxidoreductase (luciferase family)